MTEEDKHPIGPEGIMEFSGRCPCCDGDKTVAKFWEDKLKEEGRLPKTFKNQTGSGAIVGPLMDPTNSLLIASPTVPCVISTIEICSDCGCIYTSKAQFGNLPMQQQPAQRQQPKITLK